MTKPTLRDIVDGTPEGLAVVQGAMERSAEEMDKVREEAAKYKDIAPDTAQEISSISQKV